MLLYVQESMGKVIITIYRTKITLAEPSTGANMASTVTPIPNDKHKHEHSVKQFEMKSINCADESGIEQRDD